MKKIIISLLIIISILSINAQNPIIIDHTCIDLEQIPDEYIDSAKANLWIGYGGTSHSTQLTSGMSALKNYFTDGTYDWSTNPSPDALHVDVGGSGYLISDLGDGQWHVYTRNYLENFPQCNVIMWSWCGQVDDVDLPSHLFVPMEQLEIDYPDVQFVYMTGHLEGEGIGGSLQLANNQIRDYFTANNKILFDFADIEKFSPDADTNFQEYFANDVCYYNHPNGGTANWANDWLTANPSDELTQISQLCSYCAHSISLNCTKKGIATWFLWAKLSGWGNDTISDTTQNIDLNMGWNIASFYVEPSNTDMLNVIQPLINDSSIVKIMDEAGEFIQHIEPYGWMNTIGNMLNTEGYYFYVNDTTDFDIIGQQINLPYDINLQSGWNIIGYPIDVEQSAIVILQPLIDDSVLIKVMNESGEFIQYIESYGWINTIGNFKPDEGYLINVSADNTLTYFSVLKSSLENELEIKNTECFTQAQGNPYMPMNILIRKIKTKGFKIENGDELGVYDGDILVGSAFIEKDEYFQASIVVRSDDPTTPEKDGFTVGNPILFRYCDKSENKIYDNVESRYYWGDEFFTNLGTYLGRIKVNSNYKSEEINIDSNYVQKNILEQNYPNPFSSHTTIEYNISEDGKVTLIVYDMFGKTVKILENSYKPKGKYMVKFNCNDSGIYFYQLRFTGKENTYIQTKKMIVK